MNAPEEIRYTDGSVIQSPVVVIEEDLHEEGSGFFRAFWAASPDATLMSPVFGYCDSVGARNRTIKATAREVLHYYRDAQIFRNGRLVKTN